MSLTHARARDSASGPVRLAFRAIWLVGLSGKGQCREPGAALCARLVGDESQAKAGMILRTDGQRNGSRVSGFVCHSAGTPDGWAATVDRLPGLSLMKRMAGDASGVILYRPYF